MKTLLISGDVPPPAALRDVVSRGSTSLEERRAQDVPAEAAATLDADRVVLWAGDGDAAVREIARHCVRAERAQGREAIVFVTSQGVAAGVDGLSPHEVFEWPRDEDRLKMAFMTSA